MKIFEKVYTDETLHELAEHVYDVGEPYTFPTDENGFRRGNFRVVITWEDEISEKP